MKKIFKSLVYRERVSFYLPAVSMCEYGTDKSGWKNISRTFSLLFNDNSTLKFHSLATVVLGKIQAKRFREGQFCQTYCPVFFSVVYFGINEGKTRERGPYFVNICAYNNRNTIKSCNIYMKVDPT